MSKINLSPSQFLYEITSSDELMVALKIFLGNELQIFYCNDFIWLQHTAF